jgi:hypothetical protein
MDGGQVASSPVGPGHCRKWSSRGGLGQAVEHRERLLVNGMNVGLVLAHLQRGQQWRRAVLHVARSSVSLHLPWRSEGCAFSR